MTRTHKSLRGSLSLVAVCALLACAQIAAAAERVAEVAARMVLLDVRLNGQEMAEERFLADDAGRLYVRRETLVKWQLRATAPPAFRQGGFEYVALEGLHGLNVRLDQASQSVAIDAKPSAFLPNVQSLAVAQSGRPESAPLGGFLNYDAFIERTGGRTSANAALELGLFRGTSVGVSNAIVQAGGGRTRFVRLDTSWTWDRSDSLSSVRVGDTISRGGIGSVPARFAGLQFARDFAIQPNFVTLPLPSVSGTAALPSTVDVYVNGALRATQNVRPGPFQIRDIPVTSGGGAVRAVVRDALGREVATLLNYYTTASNLQAGLHDFSWEAGFLRRNYAVRSNDYGAAFASTVHRIGLTDAITLEGQATATEHFQSAGAGLIALVPGLGVATISGAGSWRDGRGGAMLTASVERRSDRYGWGVRSELATTDFAFLGLPSNQRTPKASLIAFTDAALPFGSVGLNYVRRDNRGRSDEQILSAFTSINVGQRAALQLYVQRISVGRRATLAGLNLTMPFGPRSSASLNVQGGGGSIFGTLSAQRDPPPGEGFGYRASATVGKQDGGDAQLLWNAPAASAELRVAKAGPVSGVRAGASGGLGLVGGHLVAARKLDDSFALVEVDGRAGVRVYADNHLVGVTGRDGRVVIPGLRAFEANTVSLDPADLPLDVVIETAEQEVRPGRRSGVLVRFAAPMSQDAYVRLVMNGQPLPQGASVTLNDGTETIALTGGETYLPRAKLVRSGYADWAGERCDFVLDGRITRTRGMAPVVNCRRSVDVASR